MSSMIKIFAVVFAFCLICSVAFAAVSVNPPVPVPENAIAMLQTNQPQLPDEESTWMSAIISGLGGFGGGGLLLIFLIRRFISNYDETNKKWDEKFEKMTTTFNVMVDQMWDKWEDKYDKLAEKYDQLVDSWGEKIDDRMERITASLNETKETINEISVDLAKLKETAVTKDVCFSSGRELTRIKEKVETIERAIKV